MKNVKNNNKSDSMNRTEWTAAGQKMVLGTKGVSHYHSVSIR